MSLNLQLNGDTALHVAVRRKDMETTRLLVDHSAETNLQNVSCTVSLRFTWLFSFNTLAIYEFQTTIRF